MKWNGSPHLELTSLNKGALGWYTALCACSISEKPLLRRKWTCHPLMSGRMGDTMEMRWWHFPLKYSCQWVRMWGEPKRNQVFVDLSLSESRSSHAQCLQIYPVLKASRVVFTYEMSRHFHWGPACQDTNLKKPMNLAYFLEVGGVRVYFHVVLAVDMKIQPVNTETHRGFTDLHSWVWNHAQRQRSRLSISTRTRFLYWWREEGPGNLLACTQREQTGKG